VDGLCPTTGSRPKKKAFCANIHGSSKFFNILNPFPNLFFYNSGLMILLNKFKTMWSWKSVCLPIERYWIDLLFCPLTIVNPTHINSMHPNELEIRDTDGCSAFALCLVVLLELDAAVCFVFGCVV
jgi:hypothetical protein